MAPAALQILVGLGLLLAQGGAQPVPQPEEEQLSACLRAGGRVDGAGLARCRAAAGVPADTNNTCALGCTLKAIGVYWGCALVCVQKQAPDSCITAGCVATTAAFDTACLRKCKHGADPVEDGADADRAWGGPAVGVEADAAGRHVAGVVPAGWRAVRPTPRGQRIELTFAVKQRQVEKLHDALMSVSMPSSENYGRHLSSEEVHRLVAPAAWHVQVVRAFVEAHGAQIVAETPNSDLITVHAPVEVAERMLSAKYVELAHERTGAAVYRTPGGYALPPAVAAAVDFVAPTLHLPGVRSLPPLRASANSSQSINTPKNLRQLYSVGEAVGQASANRQAVTAFLEQYYSAEDLQKFWKQYCGGITCGKGLPKLVGDATAGQPGVESMLDVETITGVAGNVATEFWGFSGRAPGAPQNEPFMKWLTKLSSTGDDEVPKIFSTSYGEDESTWSYTAASRLNVEFMKAGARGISLLYASGDEGANCEGGKFVPETPGSSPYVTAVGGTEPHSGFPEPGSESAVGLSSGGFSGYWPAPEWQKAAVAEYLKQPGLPPHFRGYNVSARAYPDISAQAANFCVTPFGCGVAGTSCASPTAAGIFALLNDLRLQHGKSTLGFLNPLVYAHAGAFNDVTRGSSRGCGIKEGWPAKTGWDAVTGVGTPNYEKLAKVVLGLPAGAARTSASIVI